jgi:hypothetical protein
MRLKESTPNKKSPKIPGIFLVANQRPRLTGAGREAGRGAGLAAGKALRLYVFVLL